MFSRHNYLAVFMGILLALSATSSHADELDEFARQIDVLTNDRPVPNEVVHPSWFKISFLDFADDIKEAKQANKKGIAIYFGQKDCAYCKAMMEENLKTPDIARYMQKNFDVIALDIWNTRQVTNLEGEEMTERQFAIHHNTNFTPSFLFYDTDGNIALRLRGYYPPYTFRAALKYVAEGFYKEEPLASYMDRADQTAKFELEELNYESFFERPPYVLDRSRFAAEKPLIVFFERKSCHACDILHSQPLRRPAIRDIVRNFETVQLDIESDEPVLTPGGEQVTAREWADKLGIFYTPTLLFFDETGKEIIRLDSVAGQYRISGVMRYVLSKAYKKYPTYLEYRFGRGDAF
jgi:thioredoxin-related protein